MSNCPFADQSKSLLAVCKSGDRIGLNNFTVGRKIDGKQYKIDRITLHGVWGHLSLQSLAAEFQTSTQHSSNYGIDDDGKIGMFVPEDDRSWCSDSRMNDVRAVTVEMNNDKTSPNRMLDATVNAAIKLCVDVCIRNGIRKMYWIPNLVPYPYPSNDEQKKANEEAINRKNDSLRSDEGLFTVHCWFFNKTCPGNYLLDNMTYVCNMVNKGIDEILNSKLAIRRNISGEETEIMNVEVLSSDNTGTKPVKLLYVNGQKYVTFNNFDRYTTTPAPKYDIDESNSFNTLWGYGKKLVNSPVSMTERNISLFKTTFTVRKSPLLKTETTYVDMAYLDVMYVFSDCSYDFRIKVMYGNGRLGYYYPKGIEVFAKSKAVSEVNFDAKKYSEWVKIHDGVISTDNDSIDIEIVGYIRNQSTRTAYVNYTFNPQFKIKIGNVVEKFFDFDGYTIKEDLKTNYCGTFPRVDIAALGEKISEDDSCMKVNVKAISFTPIDKLV